MSMTRSLFRPGKGQTLAHYTSAFASETMYPGDWVHLNTLVPTSQGVSGVIEGKTLGATDYVECALLLVTGILGCGSLALGCLMGKGIGSVANWADVSGNSAVDGDLVVIQGYGVHPNAGQADTGLLGDYLTASTVAGEPLNGVSATVTGDLQPLGVVMVNSTTYKRVAAADTHGSVAFVTCYG